MQDVDAHNINLNQNNIQAHNKSKNNTTCENDGSLSNKNLLMARNPTLKSRVSYCDTCPKGGGVIQWNSKNQNHGFFQILFLADLCKVIVYFFTKNIFSIFRFH